MKNALDSFPEPKVTPSNSFFCPNKSPKPKDCSFTVITDEEKQQILTFAHKRLIFWFEKWLKTIIRTETHFSRPTNQLIDAALTSGVESSPDIKTENSDVTAVLQVRRTLPCTALSSRLNTGAPLETRRSWGSCSVWCSHFLPATSADWAVLRSVRGD